MWEYTIQTIINNDKINKSKLGKLGRDGWELITLRGNVGIFKRKANWGAKAGS